MAKREIVWTTISEIQLKEILLFYKIRNKSGAYSGRLYKKFKTELNKAAKNPEIGLKTKLENIRGLIVEEYILFYEILSNRIIILKIWDCRQNPEKLEFKR